MNKYEKNLLGCDGDLVLGGIGVDIESFVIAINKNARENRTTLCWTFS